MSLFCRNLWTKCASRTDNYEDSSRNESKSNGFMFRENWNSRAVSYIYCKQTTTFRAIPVQTEHSYQTCRPLRTHCSGSVDTSGLKHKHTKLIIMTFWFLIREQNAPWMKPPEFSRKSPVLYAFMVWPHPLNNLCSSSTAKGVTSKWNSAGYMWCWAPGAHCTASPLP